MLSNLESWELRKPRECPGRKADLVVLTTSSPLALITPAKSHPEVIIQAVASRDRAKAEAFAKSHGIPEVKNSYQGKCQQYPGSLGFLLMRFATVWTHD